SGDKVRAAEGLFGISYYTIPKSRPTLSGGTAVSSTAVDEHYSTYAYDAATGTYTKTEEGHAYRDASLGQPLRMEMVIVLHTKEWLLDVGDGHGAHIHDFDLDSGGRIEVYYKGQQYSGAWASNDRQGPLVFTLDSGQSVTLPPGLVWIDVVS
ncbi:MAG TPA: DUF3048 C-terminal domain-containing protein, partial [Candidatus Dormibacteraeota bacterium]|nr:DUF3048 C-terminal domain-containing protein [Candidatus Dormibacteraeota bacterium]